MAKISPPPIRESIADPNGNFNRVWVQWFTDQFNKLNERIEQITDAVAGNLPVADVDGSLVDSGYDPSDFSAAIHTHEDDDNGGTIDHGDATTGLTDDDHTIYLLADGTRDADRLNMGDGVNYTEVKTDGEIELHGTARVERHLPLGVGVFVKHGNNDPTLNDEGLYTTQDFAQGAIQELFYEKNVPYRWDDATDMEVEVFWMLDGNEANAALFVRWGVSYKATAVGEAVAGAGTSFTTDKDDLDVANYTAGTLIRTVMTTDMLAANMDYHEALGIRVYRDGVADDAAGDARLIAVRIHFIMNTLGQAT